MNYSSGTMSVGKIVDPALRKNGAPSFGVGKIGAPADGEVEIRKIRAPVIGNIGVPEKCGSKAVGSYDDLRACGAMNESCLT